MCADDSAVRHLFKKPHLGVGVGEAQVAKRAGIQRRKASLGDVDEAAASRGRQPGVEASSRIGEKRGEVPSGEIASSIRPLQSPSAAERQSPSSGFVQK